MMRKICSKFTMKTPGRRKRRCSSVFIVNFESNSHIFLMFPLLTWTNKILVGNTPYWGTGKIFALVITCLGQQFIPKIPRNEHVVTGESHQTKKKHFVLKLIYLKNGQLQISESNYKSADNYKITPLTVQCRLQSMVWLGLELPVLRQLAGSMLLT